MIRAMLAIPAAGLGYFFSAWILMIFGGILSDDLGTKPFGYPTSLVLTIAIWLAIAPVVGAIARSQRIPFLIRSTGHWRTVDAEARMER
ncbi:MAG: hypothetical protein FJ314_09605 [SAR202 cluster bacterium]|nr:hypothetical protein [SAR202 cluster bacterium]